jgi:imidazolonepropionase-like amidohydrolase
MRMHTVGQLHRARVYIVSGSDSGINPSRRQRHGALPEAVIDLVHGGVCTADALASATALAATACGVGDRNRRLAADFAADFLLVGDPWPISLPSETRSRLLARPPRYVPLRGRSAGRRARAPLTPTRIQVSGGNV